MTFGELTAMSSALRTRTEISYPSDDMTKEAIIGAITAPLRMGAKYVAKRMIRKPLSTTFAGLTAIGALGAGRSAYKDHVSKSDNIRRMNAFQQARGRASRLNPTPTMTPMSGF